MPSLRSASVLTLGIPLYFLLSDCWLSKVNSRGLYGTYQRWTISSFQNIENDSVMDLLNLKRCCLVNISNLFNDLKTLAWSWCPIERGSGTRVGGITYMCHRVEITFYPPTKTGILAELRLDSEIIGNFRNFEKFFIILLSVKNDPYRRILSA